MRSRDLTQQEVITGIPMSWFLVACRELSPKTVNRAIILHHVWKMRRNNRADGTARITYKDAARYGISKTALQETFRRLESCGLIRANRGKGRSIYFRPMYKVTIGESSSMNGVDTGHQVRMEEEVFGSQAEGLQLTRGKVLR